MSQVAIFTKSGQIIKQQSFTITDIDLEMTLRLVQEMFSDSSPTITFKVPKLLESTYHSRDFFGGKICPPNLIWMQFPAEEMQNSSKGS